MVPATTWVFALGAVSSIAGDRGEPLKWTLMATRRQTVDLSSYPDLVVIYLGMRVNALRGVWTLMKIGPQISRAAAAKPDGLLRHETFLFSLLPPHAGIRQYWRDFDALERWARTLPHQTWWRNFLHDSEGTAFWHETYFMRGGIEAIYDDLFVPVGLSSFAPIRGAKGPMFGARQQGEPAVAEGDIT